MKNSELIREEIKRIVNTIIDEEFNALMNEITARRKLLEQYANQPIIRQHGATDGSLIDR